MRITLYTDVLSLWCHYAEDSLAALLARRPAIAFNWKISLIRGEEAIGFGAEAERWYYRRAAAITGRALNPEWLEGASDFATLPANLVVEAARQMGVEDGGRRALMRAGMEEGRPIVAAEQAARIVAQAAGLDDGALLARSRDEEVRRMVLATSREMLALGVDQRPTIVFENTIPDRAILSGVWAQVPLEALADAMIADEERFIAFNRANPQHS